MNKDKVLVVIVTYNAMRWAERCFSSLLHSNVKPDVIVIDNGSNDGTQDFIKSYFPDAIIYQSSNNLGFGKANNIGLQYALDHNYDYVYLLNQDAWLLPNTLECLIELSVKYPDYGILSPFQMNADMCTIDRNFASTVCSWNSNHQLLSDLYNKKLSDIYSVKSVMAAHWFMPISTVKEIGGFSPSFPHYGEDDNYLSRLLFRNLKIGIVPALRVVHDRGGRIETSEMRIYKGYISSILAISDPYYSLFKGLIMSVYYLLYNMVLYKSLKPILFFFKMLFNLHSIIMNKRDSINRSCAFLNCCS